MVGPLDVVAPAQGGGGFPSAEDRECQHVVRFQ